MSQSDSFLFRKATTEKNGDNWKTEEVTPSAEGFQSGIDYIKVTIVDRNLQKTMPWVSRYPAVHFRAHNGEDLDFNTFLAPEFLSDMGAKNVERVYQSDQTALGPIAYKNGLQLEFGLFGATSSDHLGTALGIFQELSQFSSSAFVSEALPFSGILKRSIDIAVGSGDEMKLNVGFKGSVSSLPGPGTYALVWKGKRQIRPDSIHIDPQSSLVNERGAPFRSAPYIVFEVERKNWRDDWELIPELREPWEAVRAAGRANHFGDFEAAIGVFKRACILSRDLCRGQIDQLRKFADDIVFDAKETFEASFESAGDFRFDSDPGNMSAAFSDMYEAQNVSGDAEGDFEAVGMANMAKGFIINGVAKEFVRKARSWKSRRSAPPAVAAASDTAQEPSHSPAMPDAFARSMDFVLKWEGGFVDDPDDPGGRTNKGVTQKTYDRWLRSNGMLSEDVLHITEEQVYAIYLDDYWKKVVQKWYPDNLATALFDSAVNMGPRRAISMLQHAINQTRTGHSIGVDGIAGNQTYTALRDCISSGAQGALLETYVKVRRGVYHSIVDRRPRSAKFLNGWLNRLNDLARFVGAGSEFESFGEEITPHVTKRIEDLGADDPLEKPLENAPRKPSMLTGSFEAVTSATTEDLVADAEDILGLDDHEERHASALELVLDALNAPWQSREANVKAVLNHFRKGRDFDLLHIVATEAEREGTARPLARTFRAQALIELGLIDEAILTLEDALDDRPKVDIQMEVRGLLGRSHKAAYFESIKDGQPDTEALMESIDAYLSTFVDFKGEALWHGVNALALLKRTDTDGNSLKQDVDREELARSIISLGLERIAQLPKSATIWDRASVAEAHIALGDWEGVEKHLADYISLTKEKFTLGSTLRQFKEVWQLDSQGAPAEARKIVAELHTALAATPGAVFELTPEDLDAMEALSDTERARDGDHDHPVVDAFQNSGDLETIIGGEQTTPFFNWAENLVRIGKAVARVTSNRGHAKGTAFLINGAELFGEQAQGRHFVMTNEHVVNATGKKPGIMPQSALLTFTRFPNATPVRIKKLIWSSPRSDHDTTILEIEEPPAGSEVLSLAHMPALADTDEAVRFVTVIGHPGGRELSLAINNLKLLEHNGPGDDGDVESVYMRYSSSTEPGNSGSPVFDWETMALMGIHHKGFRNEGHVSFKNKDDEDEDAAPPKPSRRRRGRPGTRRSYRKVKHPTQKRIKANQGIWLRSVLRAIQQNHPMPPQV